MAQTHDYCTDDEVIESQSMKNGWLKKLQQKRVNASYLASINMVGLVCS